MVTPGHKSMEGQATEVRGEGKNGGGGGESNESCNDKIIALAPPAIKEITIN